MKSAGCVRSWPVDADEEIELALGGPHLGDVDAEDAAEDVLEGMAVGRGRLSTKSVVSPGAMPNSTFIDRQAWMAASLRACCRPRLPFGSASRFIAGSNQIFSEAKERRARALRYGPASSKSCRSRVSVRSCQPATTLDSRDESFTGFVRHGTVKAICGDQTCSARARSMTLVPVGPVVTRAARLSR